MLDATQDVGDLFRLAMRRLAATVTVVTTRDGDVNFGMTASAVTSLAMQPPSLLVCINKSVTFHRAVSSNHQFCVNILSTGHDEISAAFGGGLSAEERFRVGSWSLDGNTPYLNGAQANIFCRRGNIFDHGTHSIVIGEVTGLKLSELISPLIYVDGRYAAVAAT